MLDNKNASAWLIRTKVGRQIELGRFFRLALPELVGCLGLILRPLLSITNKDAALES